MVGGLIGGAISIDLEVVDLHNGLILIYDRNAGSNHLTLDWHLGAVLGVYFQALTKSTLGLLLQP